MSTILRSKQKTSVASIYGENTQVLKLCIEPSLIKKMKEIEKLTDTNMSIILTELMLLQLCSLKKVEPILKLQRCINQYVLPISIKDQIKYAAIYHKCYAYQIVEECIKSLKTDDENIIIKNLLAKFR